ncbi:type I polyketide synthase [Actinophytocola oryzae]|uniref:6-deoxyerythronolide-B synthase n=1 Tax=Actinophytocola oryzae TaxID=502181 RepID=A0A4R7VJY9_9PSEU|nr:type I polyketide synthase [Actinophytocola oryzae]TDV49773.1 acyl transferase domain-containing protein [Actinophytocola oryzae]
MASSEKIAEALRESLKDANRLRGLNRELTARHREPVAVVGMACRFPGGVSSPEELWALVASGGDAITPFPSDRGWPDLFDPDPGRAGRSCVREGGFLADAAGFDAEFFGISPREAVAMDPQQRVFLEVCWEAVEHAGLAPGSLAGSRTGVFAGVSTQGYGGSAGSSEEAEGYVLTGNAASVVSGRVSYVLGLAGPAVSVDTACSSSLVSLHLAVQALRNGDCALALAGGVTVMATPGVFVGFSRQRGLAADGRCKPFAAAADGIGLAEGAGVVVLARLSDARRDGLPILAVVRGSSVNQDGTSSGLSAPNGPAQERVIRQALANAGLGPADVDAVEAHGTGTRLGDPIEARAVSATYGQGRATPLWLGSVKSNIGHTQAAAGVAGVIKMVMALRENVLPRTLHVDEPTPHVDWSAGAVELLTSPRAWPDRDRPRRFGVSSFGVSGTNAHVVFEEAPRAVVAPRPDVPSLWVLSGRSGEALRAQAGRLKSWVDSRPDLSAQDVGLSLATTRSHFGHRAAVVGDRDALVTGLTDLSRATVGRAAADAARPVFVFPGQGSQWVGMAAELLDVYPAFAARMGECAEALEPYVDWTLPDVLHGELDRVEVVQPVLWAVMVSLAGLWRSFGVEPAAVVGHSQGEIAAACVAGALSLEDGARVVALRSRALRDLSGGMVSIPLPAGEVRDWLGDGVSIAAVNGPGSVVASGEVAAVVALSDRLRAAGVDARRLAVDYAAHSAQVGPVRDELSTALSAIRPRSSEVPFVSTVTGAVFDTAGLDARYWFDNLREPVRFADATRAVLAEGHRVLLEVGPHPVLSLGMQQTLDEAGITATLLATLRRDDGGRHRMLTALGQAYVAGVMPDWDAVFAGDDARRVRLPTYAFQHRPYWLTPPMPSAPGHPLLDTAVDLADDQGTVLTGRLSAATHPWLAGHTVLGSVVAPGTLLVELAWQAGERVGCARLDELVLRSPLVLPEQGEVRVQVRVGADDTGRRPVSVHTQREGHDWRCHATGVVGAATRPVDLEAWPPAGAEAVDVAPVYDVLAGRGFAYGPVFQCLTAAWRRGDEVFAEVALPDGVDVDGYGIHPALLDSAMHAFAYVASGAQSGTRLPFAWTGVSLYAVGATASRVRVAPATSGDGAVSIVVADGSGAPVAAVDSLVFRPVDTDQLVAPAVGHDSLLHLDWVPADTDGVAGTEGWAVLGPHDLGLDLPVYPDLDALAGARVAPTTVVFDLSREDTPVGTTLTLLRSWLAESALDGSRLVLVTRGAVPVGDEAPDLAAASAWGLTRSAQVEHPGRFVLVDTDDTADVEPSTVAAAVDSGEPQCAIRAGAVFVPRLTPVAGRGTAPEIDPDGTVLITGGLGLLGAETARHLVAEYGVRRLVLAGRRGADTPGAPDLAAELTAGGADVRVVACDVADRSAVAALLASIPDEHPLTGVVHAAGVLDDGVVETLTPDRLATVCRPKADGAWHLHELTKDRPLALFVLFSSLAGILGAAGQGGYAAANAYQDALARYRAAAGLPATSIAWGLWDRPSELTGRLGAADRARQRRTGMSGLSVADGLALFDRAVTAGHPVVAAARLDRAALHERGIGDGPPPLFRALLRTRPRQATNRAGTPSLTARLAALPHAERDRAVLALVRQEAAAVLGHVDDRAIDPGRAFRESGFDSLTAVEFRNRLAALTGLRLPATLVFDHPNPLALSRHVLGRLSGARTADAPASVAATGDPVAVVGMSCRLPGGVSSPEDLWDLVVSGGDAVGPFPDDRGWDLETLFDPDPGRAGTSYVREGGFLADAAGFDAEFFGISPREALAMDPQQRLLLELSWEALERAGFDPRSLAGSPTGVFAGVMYHDYLEGLREVPAELEGYVGNGNAGSVVSGRVAYALGLEGPALSVDTACSSSLVAVHLAAQSLRSGECSLALAGGVTVMATPGPFVGFSRQRGLAVDGRCKSFAAAADGTGLSEGVGMLVLERLSDARRNGHPVLAVLRGSAVNQDGASNGLSAPNGPSQERVIRQALTAAGLSGVDVDAVEAHGTGTRLGDPIEAQAVLATYGQDRDEPLWLGSVKSNIGHTQATAGVAGVIKMVMALRHGVLPRTLFVDEPTPHVDWSAGAVELLTTQCAWPERDRPRRFAVSSFGASGTNAHAVFEQPPVVEPGRAAGGDGVWLLSARTEDGLRAQASRLREHVTAHPELGVADVGHSLATTRTHFSQRAAVSGGRSALLAGLAAIADGGSGAGVVRGTALADRPVFVFPGQGSQWVGMAVDLMDAFPVFAARMGECAAALESHVSWSLAEVLGDEEALGRVDVVQPVLWAVMVSLAHLWQSFGVRPAAVVGHSQGEIAAACVAGALSLQDGARVVALRGKALRGLSGGMASVPLSENETLAWLRTEDGLSVAAVNGPRSVVVSGEVAPLGKLLEQLHAAGVDARRIAVDYAAHSARVDQVREELLTALTGTDPRPSEVPFVSTVTGEVLDTTALDARYWFDNLRDQVRFEDATRTVLAKGHQVLLEVSPHPVLSLAMQQTLDDTGVPGNPLATLRRDDGGRARMLTALAGAHCAGVEVDWRQVHPGARVVDLPTYAFQRERYWLPGGGDRSVMASWRYVVEWVRLTAGPGSVGGRWLVAVPSGVVDPRVSVCVDALRARGVEVVWVEVDCTVPDRIGGYLPDVRVDGVLSFLAFDDRWLLGGVPAGLAANVGLLRAFGDVARMWWVTAGAVSTGSGDALTCPARSMVWGLGRVAALEYPAAWGGLVDLPAVVDGVAAERFVGVLGGVAGEDQVAVRPAGVFGRRLVRAPGRGVGVWRPRGTVLVTGGTGALGRRVARWLVGNGAEHVVLLSRRGVAAQGVAELRAEFGGLVSVVACDVTDRDALARVLAEYPPSGVVHAAGVGASVLLSGTGPAELGEVLAAKVVGALNLHELLRGVPLDAFVLFSSGAGVWGSGGQGGYAAGNAYLDGLAEFRRSLGLPALSVAWGMWAGGGMVDGVGVDRLVRHGVMPMDPGVAVAVLGQAVGLGEAHVVVADIDWPRFVSAFTSGRPSALLADLPAVAGVAAAVSPGESLHDRIAGRTTADQDRLLLELVRREAAGILGHPGADAVAPGRAFRDMGFDSLTAVELRNRLNALSGLSLPATFVFDHPNPAALATALRTRLAGGAGRTIVASDLDRVEKLLNGLRPDDQEFTEGMARIEAMLRRGRRRLERAGDPPTGDLIDRIDGATDDEIFGYIGAEFGITAVRDADRTTSGEAGSDD